MEILGLERVDAGPMMAGTVAEFMLVVRGEWDGLVQWEASGGDLQTSGVEARWLLPDQQKASLRARLEPRGQAPIEAEFVFQIIDKDEPTWAVNPLATGLIDPTPDTITGCRVVIDDNDVPHVLYRSGTHLQLWYATFSGSSWSIDFVDGPGFDIGGLVANDFNLVIDSSGDPHVVYRYQNFDDVRYATLSGSTWIREAVNTNWTTSSSSNGRLAIDLDPINGERPTVAWSWYDSYWGYVSPVIAYRTGSASWTEEQYTINSSGNYVTGGLKFTASGVAWMTYDYNDGRIVNWSSSGGFFDSTTFAVNGFDWSSYMPLELDGSNQPIVLTDEAIFHRVGVDWLRSDYEASDMDYYDLAVDSSGDPRIATRHGSDLELIETDSEGFWQYDEGDEAIDSAPMGVAVDTSNNTHSCYIKDGQLWFY
ncbi:MAG: hypothetical protein GY884_03550 [Proteobacteria bacterium]|nr:hypothetical protein [Pseudomonadota bacterium]